MINERYSLWVVSLSDLVHVSLPFAPATFHFRHESPFCRRQTFVIKPLLIYRQVVYTCSRIIGESKSDLIA